MLREFPSKGRT